MRNNKFVLKIASFLLVFTVILFSKCASTAVKKIKIKSLKKDTYLLGATLNHHELNTEKENLFLKDFKFLTPANASKQRIIHPMPNVWNWKPTDDFLEFAKKNEIVVRLHSPIGPQASWWIKKDERTAEELSTNLEEFMTAFCKRYNNNFNAVWMDVVNETVLYNGEWHGPKSGIDEWENPWLKIGLDENGYPKYILKAFEIATKDAPNLKLVFNQNAGMEDPLWEKIKKTILYIRSKGFRVDGIGWQGHLLLGAKRKDFVDNIDSTLLKLSNLIDWAHQNSLEFHITELDYLVKEENLINLAEEREIQYEIYKKIVSVVKEKSKNGFVSLNLWDLGVRYGKGEGYYQSIYDENLKPTKAYTVFKDYKR